jgi:UDP-3-O-[3-hydroxymyristoyl] glucosamine N-acyltransferase
MRVRLVGLALAIAPVASATTLTFRQGDGGSYSTTDATEIYSVTPTTNSGALYYFRTGSSGGLRALLRFPDLIGTNVGQIPPGAVITSATLYVKSETNPSDTPQNVHRVLTSWSENAVTWNSFNNGGTAGVDYVAAAVGTFTAPNPTTLYSVDVTAAVQAWASGAPNYGVLILNSLGDTDALVMYTDDAAGAGDRPQLNVTYELPVADADGDTVADATDNCPSVPNSTQTNSNADGSGDACAHPTANTGAGRFGGQYASPHATIGATTTFDTGSLVGRRAEVGDAGTFGAGVFVAPDVLLGDDLVVGDDVTFGFGSVVEDGADIGAGSTIGSLARLDDGPVLLDDVTVGRSSWIEGGGGATDIDSGARIGAGVHVRPGAQVGAGTKVSTGAAIHRRADIGSGALIGRGASIGEDAVIGDDVVVRAGAVVRSGQTVASGVVARGAEVGSATIRTINATDGNISDFGDPLCRTSVGDVYFSADNSNFYVGVTGIALGGTLSQGPFLSFVFRNADGQASTYWAYDFPGGSNGWSYGVTMFDTLNLCYLPFNSGTAQCGNAPGQPDTWPHYKGHAGNPTTEVAIPRSWLGSYGSGSGTVQLGVFAHTNFGGNHQVNLVCATSNPTGSWLDGDKADWTTWATAPYPTYRP